MARVKHRRRSHGRRLPTRGGGVFVDSDLGITGFSPASVAQGSGAVSPLSVLGFGFTPTSVVWFNGSAVTTNYQNSGELQITVPSGTVLVPGFYPVFVVDASYPATSTTKVWGVRFPVPTLASLNPTFGYLGAASVNTTTTGTGFFNAGTDALVDGVNRAWSYASSTSGTLTVPNANLLAAGTRSVVIVNPEPGGGTSSAATFSVRYRTPAITAVSTSIIPVDSGDFLLTLTDSGGGYYLASAWPDGGTVGYVDNVAVATSWTSTTSVTLTIPAAVTSSPGTKVIKVGNPTVGGGGGLSAGTNVSVSAPTTTALSFASRVRGFDPYTLRTTGTNFTNTDSVHYRGAALATTYVNATTLDAVIPASVLAVAGAGDVTVVTATGYETNAQTFTVIDWTYVELGSTLRGLFPGSGLVDDGTGRASEWTEAIVGTRNPTQTDATKRPNIVSAIAALNNMPGAYFDGARGDYLEYVQWVVSGAAGFVTKSAYTVFVVGSALGSAQVGSDPTILGEPGPLINVANLQANAIRASDNGANAQTSFTWSGGAPFIFRSRKTGGNVGATVNRGSETTAAASATYSPTTVLVGRGRSGTWQYAGYLGFWLVCDSNLNHTYQAQLWNLLAYEYGAPYGTVGSVLVPSAVSPNTGTQFDVPFEITVTVASGAVSGDVVNADGHPLVTVVDSGTSLRAMLTAEVLLTYGVKGITVSNAAGIGPPVALTIAQFNPGTGANLTSVSPNSATRCDDGFDMTCNGSNFTLSSVVRVDGVDIATSFFSSTLIVGHVTEAILYSSGSKNVTVYDPAGTSGAQVLSVAAWNPYSTASIPEVSDWLDGDSVNVTGSNITQCNDQTGAGRHAVQATSGKQPLLVTADAAMGNANTMDFDGTNDELVVTGVNIAPNILTGNAWTALVVYRADAITGSTGTSFPFANNNLVSLNATGYFGMALRTGPLLYAYTNDGAYKTAVNSSAAVTTTQYAVFRKFGGTSYLSINGGTEATASSGTAGFSSQNLSLGSGLAANYYNGRIGCVGTFTDTPSAANLTRLKNYTRIKYGWI